MATAHTDTTGAQHVSAQTVQRRALRRPAGAARAALAGRAERALDQAYSALAKGVFLTGMLMILGASAVYFVQISQQLSMQGVVESLTAAPPPTLSSRVASCVTPHLERPAGMPRGPLTEDAVAALEHDTALLQAATAFVECLTERETARLCEPAARKVLAADLKLQAGLHADLAAAAAAVRSARADPRMDRLFVGRLYDLQHRAVAAAETAVQRADDLVPRVAAVAAAGRLSGADFGLLAAAVPAGLKPALAAAAPVHPCRG